VPVTRVPADALLGRLPPVPDVDAATVASAAAVSGRRLVVLDDDPTGTQTVADLPVITSWGVEDFRWGLAQDAPALFVSTNTRSLDEHQTESRLRELVPALVRAARAAQVDFVIASRSDSTLRGHYPLETDVLADCLKEHLGTEVDGVLVVPAFLDAGRLTVDSVHWMAVGSDLVPVSETEFAADLTFGYGSSDLREYVAEKTRGRWPANEVARVTLDDIRGAGVNRVAEILESLDGGRPVVVDAVRDEDLSIVALAAIEAEGRGRSLLYRVGPSFVRARVGLPHRPELSSEQLAAIVATHTGPPASHGLIAVGSHVDTTTRQLARLCDLDGIEVVELDVSVVLGPDGDAHVRAVANQVQDALTRGDVVVHTSRAVRTDGDRASQLRLGGRVSAALVSVVRSVASRRNLGWVVAKGGITSIDVARHGLGIRRAHVAGSLFAGTVSLWVPATSEVFRAPLAVFPGNVGDELALVAAVTRLRGASRA